MRRVSQQEWENEHMHNPMTEGEALAVLRRLKDALPDVGLNGWMEGVHAVDVAIATLTAHTAASAGEVVGYYLGEQNGFGHRISFPDGVTLCYTKTRDEALALIGRLNRTPPDAVPADALERLLCRVYTDAYHAGHHDTVEGGYTDVLPVDRDSYWRETVADEYADELAALIPKGADHGQR